MEDLQKLLLKTSNANQCTRSALALYQACLKDSELERAAKMREEARLQAMDGARAFVEMSKIIADLEPSEVTLDRPAILDLVENPEALQG